MKHLILTLLSTICFVISTQAQIEVDGVYYETCSDGVKVVSGDYSGDITIPLEIKYYDGLDDKTYTYKVAAIEDNAFSRNTDITSIKIDALIKKLDVNDCKSLKTLELPNTVEELICDHCPSLTSIPFPANMKELPSLDGCGSITSLTIPTTITSLGNGFYGMDNLESVTIEDSEKDLEYLNVGESCLRSESLKTLYLGRRLNKPISSNALETLELGKFITSLSGVFENCPALVSFKANGEITEISDRTFNNCSALTTINLPKSIKVIGRSAFENCSSLASIDFLENVNCIGSEAFLGCSSLDGIVLASGLTSISENTFWGCTSLRSISIPNTVTSLGKGAFYDCSKLKSITKKSTRAQSEGSISIGDDAFYWCSELENINIGSISRVGSGAFEGTKWLDNQPNGILVLGSTLYKYKGDAMPENTTLKVTEGINYIADGAFYEQQNVVGLSLPSSLEYIGNSAFSGNSISELSLPSSLKYIGRYAFSGNSITKVNIPASLEEIGDKAFSYNSLSELVLEDSALPLKVPEDGYLLFGNSRSELKNLYLGRTLETSLCVAFKDAPLEKITIGKDVTNIPCLFNDCYRLKQITCLATEPPVLKESYRYDDYTYPTFDDEVFEKCTLYVPEGSVDAYKKANVWKNFQNIVGTTTRISKVQDGDFIITKHYDLMGRVISPTAKGIHLVHIFDGKETKVIKTIVN